METFSALLAIYAWNSPFPGEFTAQRPVTQSFDVFFDLRLNKRLSKQWWGWWFETLSRPLWRHCNGLTVLFCYGHIITIHCDFIHSVQHEIHCVTLCITMQVVLYTEYVWTHIWHVYCILINWLYQNALCILISPSVLCTQGSPFHMGWVMEVRLSTYSKTR